MATVLLIEDEPEYASAMANWISDYEVEIANTGEGALSKLDDSIDVVLLDRRLPDMPGRKVLEEIRSSDVDCRVAMVTAVEPDFDVIEMGFDEYLVKPVTEEQIRSLVDRLVRLSQYDNQVRRLYRLASRKIALESSKSTEVLQNNPEYLELVDEFEHVRNQVDDTISELLDEDPKLLIK